MILFSCFYTFLVLIFLDLDLPVTKINTKNKKQENSVQASNHNPRTSTA